MGLESSFNFIDDLNSTNPAAGDNISEGDDHIRGIKNAVKGSFTSLGSAAVTKTAAQINDLAEKSSAQTISGAWTFTANMLLEKASPLLTIRPTDEVTQNTILDFQDELNNRRALIFRPLNLAKLSIAALDAVGSTKAALDITEAGGVDVVTGTFSATSAVLTSPVINTSISGTALETTITDTDTKVPTSGAVFDKVAGLNTATFDIGDWNMDTTFSTSISLGGIAYTKIRSLKATIRNDTDAQYYDFATHDNGESLYAQSGFIFLARTTGELFDSTDFDSTTYNRGWVVVQYID